MKGKPIGPIWFISLKLLYQKWGLRSHFIPKIHPEKQGISYFRLRETGLTSTISTQMFLCLRCAA